MERKQLTAARVEALRAWMRENGVDAYIVPTADPHNDEYVPARWMCREWLTGFDGSAGLAVVTRSAAALWTDSRYWLQAGEQLDGTPFRLMREGEPDVPSPAQWAKEEAGSNAVVSCPPDMLTSAMAQEWGISPAAALDAFDTIWADRPSLPAAPIYPQSLRYAGFSVAEKLSLVAEKLDSALESKQYLFNDLADIAWMLNLRGGDIPYNPVFLSYLLYNKEGKRYTLYTHTDTLTPEARMQLADAGVAVRPYDEIESTCKARSTAFSSSAPVCVARHGSETLESPAEALRSMKNTAERDGFREAMERDGAAMVGFLRWLDEAMAAGESVTEMGVDEKLTALRAAQPGYEQLSFATIAAYAAHGAIVHYEASPATDARLEPKGLLLLDSGAQYDCGTTDITRTIALGPLSEEERRVYTLVFKGHLALARQRFPIGTTGLQLDLAARQHMWQEGYDFGHGTGHGVGAHLCVHEGPHQIRKNIRPCTLLPITEGMTITDEPGVYVTGSFGVRIENTLLCVDGGETAFGHFLRFESLTLCPYDLRPVVREMLTAEETAQIDAYHALVRERLTPRLTDEADRRWLAQATMPIG